MKIFGRPIKYYLRLKNIKSYLRGHIIGNDLQQEYMEQFMYRYTHPECRECVRTGVCTEPCKCDTYLKMLDPKAECSKENEYGEPIWGPMYSAKEWREYKKRTGLEFYQKETKIVDGNSGSN